MKCLQKREVSFTQKNHLSAISRAAGKTSEPKPTARTSRAPGSPIPPASGRWTCQPAAGRRWAFICTPGEREPARSQRTSPTAALYPAAAAAQSRGHLCVRASPEPGRQGFCSGLTDRMVIRVFIASSSGFVART
ncbi:SH3 domain-binding glutamic acid-rich-like protein 2 isoform X6 [Callithrix jacchus]|uniref:SH3 domain-binding glutamic acid-rich-like protein 2 isoform X4 n=1 Tax=Callithrix jacchus TaxID=9483 RepID=UPI0023DD301E|nr:SH3 domain-binding glutamic acid-rich-like protein 2 isoform X4 [Callithrix jacchus]